MRRRCPTVAVNVLAASPAVAAFTDFRAGYTISKSHLIFRGATAAIA